MLSKPPNKNFRSDLEFFTTKLKNREPFTLSKYADGEWAVMMNHAINNKEFWFNPLNQNDQRRRLALVDSFKFKHDNYYVGISCPCCQGMATFDQMYNYCDQDDDHITWANIWVNSNYQYYLDKIMPLYCERNDIILFCNRKANIDNLPFKPYAYFPIDNNAWEKNWNYIEEAKLLIDSLDHDGYLFLFCCGPFGNILCHQLTKHNPDNTYLDIGSTLNPLLQSEEFQRHYYMGDNIYSRQVCTWGK